MKLCGIPGCPNELHDLPTLEDYYKAVEAKNENL